MFAKLSLLVLALPFVSALTLNAPTDSVYSASPLTITWTASTTDSAYFSIELVNSLFHNTYAIASNVQTSLGTITVTLPEVPQDDYTLEAFAVNDVNTVYSQTSPFTILVNSSTSSTSSSSSSSTGTSTSTSASASLTTPSATATTPASSASAATTVAGSSSASASPTNLNSATSFKLTGIVPAVAFALSAVAGAALVF